MEEPERKIIVYDAYDTVMQANLAKTKLDAYGIPCFLTDENFVNMYPIRNEVFPGVRLFIFQDDIDQVKEIMKAEDPPAEYLECPKCHSVNIETKKQELSPPGRFLFGLLMTPITHNPGNEYLHCLDCNHEWI